MFNRHCYSGLNPKNTSGSLAERMTRSFFKPEERWFEVFNEPYLPSGTVFQQWLAELREATFSTASGFYGVCWTGALLLSHILLEWIQHRGVFEAPTPPLLLSSLDCNTFICSQTTFLSPSPPNHPSLRLLSFILHLSPSLSLSRLGVFPPDGPISHYSGSSSVALGLSHPISPLKISASFPLPSLPPPFCPSSSSRPSSVCACLPPSFHQMVCVKTLRLTARLIFFFAFLILF